MKIIKGNLILSTNNFKADVYFWSWMKLWNSLQSDLKGYLNVFQFKERIVALYELDR